MGDMFNYMIWPVLLLVLIGVLVFGKVQKDRRLWELAALAELLGFRSDRYANASTPYIVIRSRCSASRPMVLGSGVCHDSVSHGWEDAGILDARTAKMAVAHRTPILHGALAERTRHTPPSCPPRAVGVPPDHGTRGWRLGLFRLIETGEPADRIDRGLGGVVTGEVVGREQGIIPTVVGGVG